MLTAQGPFRFLTLWLTQPALSVADAASLPALLGVRPGWIVAAGVVVVGFFLRILPRPSPSPEKWPWYFTGSALGVLGTLAWVLGAQSGWHWGLSMTGPSRTLLEVLVDRADYPMSWGAFMLLGVPLGSWLSAWLNGKARWQVAEAKEVPRRFLGGILMGFGGTVAGGCNIGNALTGLSIFSLNSLVATAGILLGLSLGVRSQASRRLPIFFIS